MRGSEGWFVKAAKTQGLPGQVASLESLRYSLKRNRLIQEDQNGVLPSVKETDLSHVYIL